MQMPDIVEMTAAVSWSHAAANELSLQHSDISRKPGFVPLLRPCLFGQCRFFNLRPGSPGLRLLYVVWHFNFY